MAFGIITSPNITSLKLPMVRQKKMDEYYMAAKNGAILKAKEIVELLKIAMRKNSLPDF